MTAKKTTLTRKRKAIKTIEPEDPFAQPGYPNFQVKRAEPPADFKWPTSDVVTVRGISKRPLTMEKIMYGEQYAGGDSRVCKEWENLTGDYNTLPPNMKPITEAEFWHKFRMYEGIIEHRKPTMERVRGEGVSWGFTDSAHIYWYHDGTALVLWGKGEKVGQWDWDRRPKFWSAALCEHSNKETLGTRTGQHEGYCVKCGLPWAYDSSD